MFDGMGNSRRTQAFALTLVLLLASTATSRRLLNLGGGRVGIHYAVLTGGVNGDRWLSTVA